MGRISTFKYLTPEQHAKADALIRKHRYAQIDVVHEALTEMGVSISRSAVGRYIQKLRLSDGLVMDYKDATVVTIVERSTGNVFVLKTPVMGAELAAHIESLTQELGIS